MKSKTRVAYVGWKVPFPLRNLFEDLVEVVSIELADVVIGKATTVSMKQMISRGNPSQVRVGIIGEALTPDFNFFDFALGFDHLTLSGGGRSRYFRPHPLLRYSHYFKNWFDDSYVSLSHNHLRPYLFDYVYSNKAPSPFRQQFFDQLSKHTEIRSYGSDRKNVTNFHFQYNVSSESQSGSAWIDEKILLQADHLFSICMENGRFDGYTSEKIMTSFAAGSIPIYWGNPSIGLDFNTSRFLDVTHCDTIGAAVEAVLQLSSNTELIAKKLSSPILTGGQSQLLISNREELAAFLRGIFLNPVRFRGDGPAQLRYETELSDALTKRHYPPNRLTRAIAQRLPSLKKNK